MSNLKVYFAQLNMIVGDFEHNIAKINFAYHEATLNHADIVVFPELAITGYPPEDLALRPAFQLKTIEIVHELANKTKHGPAIIIGTLWLEGEKLYNAAAILEDGKVSHIISKNDLPNYGVFDEYRIFKKSPDLAPVEIKGVNIGLMICEDCWIEKNWRHLAGQGAELLIAINASPFEVDKQNDRLNLAQTIVSATNLPLLYLNMVGGQDELVFDGHSFVMNINETLAYQAAPFQEEQFCIEFKKNDTNQWEVKKEDTAPIALLSREKQTYEALKLSLHDYIHKNGFPGVIIGMSGGIDSALTAAIAVDALGADKVKLVMMPSKYTSKESIEDASECANRLEVELETVAIEPAVEAFTTMLAASFEGKEEGTTEENIQSRIRGVILMAMSNKFGHMVLTTGNKSEMAVGYATLYGDMCGGFNVLKDLYKTEVFALAKWRNERDPVIPERIITKPPSAELRADQRDEDSLPSYEILDDILYRLIEKRESSYQLIHEHCFNEEVVNQISYLVTIAEYKRRQAPPGTKIGRLAFGKDRRYPITHSYKL